MSTDDIAGFNRRNYSTWPYPSRVKNQMQVTRSAGWRECDIKGNAQQDASSRRRLHLTDYRGIGCAFRVGRSRFLSTERAGGRGKNTSTLVPRRSSFPRGWSSRRVASASNLAKLDRAISRRSADVTVRVPLPVPSAFICTGTGPGPGPSNDQKARFEQPLVTRDNDRRSRGDPTIQMIGFIAPRRNSEPPCYRDIDHYIR